MKLTISYVLTMMLGVAFIIGTLVVSPSFLVLAMAILVLGSITVAEHHTQRAARLEQSSKEMLDLLRQSNDSSNKLLGVVSRYQELVVELRDTIDHRDRLIEKMKVVR